MIPTSKTGLPSLLLCFCCGLLNFSTPVMAITWTPQQPADLVLGQATFTTGSSGSAYNALNGPAAVTVDPGTGKVFVAEYPNNRVLRFAALSSLTNGATAEAVFGGSQGCTANQLNNPIAVTIDSNGRLWVGDHNGSRVLRFDNAATIPSGSAANGVLGQSNFTSCSNPGVTQNVINRPCGVAVNNAGSLWVTSCYGHRILRFDNAASKANGANADGVLGQPNFTSSAAGTTATTLNLPGAIELDAAGNLYVVDSNNNRVLRFDSAASKANGAAADWVLGQPNFTSNTAAATATGLSVNWGGGVTIDNSTGQVFVADSQHNRILIYLNPISNGMAASYVLGQPDFTTTVANNGGISASSLYSPGRLFFDATTRSLLATDGPNHRVLRYLPPEIQLLDGSTDLSLNSTVSLGNTVIGSPSTKTLTIKNLGNGNLNLTGTPLISITGTDFSVAASPTASIAPASSSNFTLQFTPSSAGTSTGTLSIMSNDYDEPSFTLNLEGTAVGLYTLTLAISGEGTGTVSSSGTPAGTYCGINCLSYLGTTAVTLTANPTDGSTFASWNCTPFFTSGNTLTANTTCTATFMSPLETHTLTISLAGNGQGQITGGQANDPEGIHCDADNIPCTYTVSGTQWIYPKITAATGSEFQGWSGDPACTDSGSNKILLLADTACTATFDLQYYTLTVDKNAPGITVIGEGLTCQDSEQGFLNLESGENLTLCQASYPYGTTVKLEASPAPPEWEWVGWSGSCDNQGQALMTQDRWCRAQYQADSNIPNGIDGNGDGLNDAYQPHVMSLADKVTGNYITLVVNPECTVADGSTVTAEMLGGAEHNHPLPQGLMAFELQCSQAEVTMYFHSFRKLLRNLEFRKYGPKIPGDPNTIGWYRLPNVSFNLVTVGDQPVVTASYTLIDGQLGDSTGVDGRIVDPAGLGYTE